MESLTMDFAMAPTLFGDSSVLLMSPWKPLVIWGVFIAWAWLVATKIDKDLRYYNLGWEKWNSIFLASGVVAVITFFTGWVFWVSLPVGVLILLTPVLVYWKIRNGSVPDGKQFYLSLSKDAAAAQQRKMEKARLSAAIQYTDASGSEVRVPSKDDPDFQIYLRTEDIMGPAIKARASRIEMLLTGTGCKIAWVIDGVRTKQEDMAVEDAAPAINFFKQIAGLESSDSRRTKSGSFSLNSGAEDTSVQMAISGSSKGPVVVIEFNRETSRLVPYDQLGLLPQQRAMLDELVEKHDRHGIVLVSAPAKQGATTTVYSLLGRHDAYTCNIKSLEYEIEAFINGVDQAEWDPMNVDVDFATNLQSILRRDPDVALVGDIRDSESAKAAAAPGRKGPLVYVGMHANSLVDCIREWVKHVGDVEEAVKPIRAVLHQRLIRKLCPNCKQQVTPEEMAAMKLPAGIGDQLHRRVGQIQIKNKIIDCPICNGTGFLGQTAVFEVLVVDQDVLKHLRSGDLKSALAAARKSKMLQMQEAALLKAGRGETSLDEIARVLSPKKKKQASKAKVEAS
tara:strand:+ start:2286 stop:3980 length:1695 start_codon:yes stop_codon:yes gene_type:complete